MAKSGSIASRLYRGDVSFDFVGRRRIWYAGSIAVVLISLASLLFRGIHPSIDFKGGAVFEAPAHGHSVSEASRVFTDAGVTPEVAQKVGEGRIRIQTGSFDKTNTTKTTDLQKALASKLGVPADDIAVNTVGPTWGGQITKKAIEGLVVFLALLFVLLSVRFEPKMAVAAFVALVHDIIITAGIYSLVGFEVSPATIIALLTILGYSLYDTVVVFDKVRENTVGLAGGSRITFSSAANLALNQTLVRSINTTVIALLPVMSLLFIGAGLLGAGTLKDLALALFIGLLSGAYSSIFTATPLVCDLKEREPQFQALARRVSSRQSAGRIPVPAGAPPRAAGTATLADGRGGSGSGSVALQVSSDEPNVPEQTGPPAQPAPPPRPARKPASKGSRQVRPSGKRRR